MSQSYESDGATFLFNPGLDGNVTIMSNGREVTVSGHALLALAEEVLGKPKAEQDDTPTVH